ncbi:MAG: Fe-S cluster assembly protein NifU, partial [Desulfovibrio sp.]|nr:Fe-S cluster assembly protein NifU [Desulfovibrio sp.]
MWDYSQKVQDLFLNPHNAGPLEDANAIGEVGSIACGDALKLYLKISPAGVIEKAGFETFGCASAIASSSVLTDMVIGMHVDEALKITNADIAKALDGLPREKMHCSVMGQEALEAAIRQWKGEPAMPKTQEEGRLVCKCFNVTDATIIRAIRENGLKTVEDVTAFTKAGGGCGDCRDEIAEILEAELRSQGAPASRPAEPAAAKPA